MTSPLLKVAIEKVPPSDMNRSFFSRYFLVLEKDRGLRPILDLFHLNFSLYKEKLKILILKALLAQIRVWD